MTEMIALFPDMPCTKRVTAKQRRRPTGRQPGTRRASDLLNDGLQTKPLVNSDFAPAFGLHRVLFSGASRKMFRRGVLVPLGGTWDTGFLCLLFCRRPALPGPARPPRRAPQPNKPVLCPSFGFDKRNCCAMEFQKY